MTHDEAARLLTDYVTGRLPEATRVEFARHLVGCSECTGLVEMVQILSTASPKKDEDRGPPTHPASEEIVAFALRPESLPHERRIVLSAHVRSCDHCAHEADLVADTDEEVASGFVGGASDLHSGSRTAWTQAWPRLALLAASIGAAGMTYLGFYRLPRLQSEVKALEEDNRRLVAARPAIPSTPPEEPRPAPTLFEGGIVRIHPLPEPRRSAGASARITLGETEPTLYLSVEARDLPGGPGAHFILELLTLGGEALWSKELRSDDLPPASAASPEWIVAIPSAGLTAGTLRLRLRQAGAVDPVLEIRFDLKRTSAKEQSSTIGR